MSSDTINKKLQNLKQDVDSKQKQIKDIEELLKEYSDLEITVDRWKNEFYLSKIANIKVNDFEIRNSCGCCSDSAWFVYPYVRTNNGLKIYSKPYRFCIGEKNMYSNTGHTCFEEDEVKQNLEKENISKNIIDKIVALVINNNESNKINKDDESE